MSPANLIDVEQRSPEWFAMRNGMVTASRVADVCAKLKKGGYAACRQDYLMEVVVSRLTGLAPDHFVTPAMQWGMEQEPFARAAYEIHFGRMVESGGFAIHPQINFFGASPDGYVGDDGLIEIKCPNSDRHLEYVLASSLPEEYCPQMLAQMACTGREFVDFVSFDPRQPPELQLFVRRFRRDEKLIGLMEQEVELFLEEVKAKIAEISQARMIVVE